MVTNNGLMRIFWPSDASAGSSAGVLLGWRNSGLDFFVVTVMRDVEVSCLSGICTLLLTRRSRAQLRTPCALERFFEMPRTLLRTSSSAAARPVCKSSAYSILKPRRMVSTQVT